MKDERSLGQIAYEAYDAHGPNAGKDYRGEPTRKWHEMREDVREKWEAAALAAQKASLVNPTPPPPPPPPPAAPPSEDEAAAAQRVRNMAHRIAEDTEIDLGGPGERRRLWARIKGIVDARQ